MPAIYGVDNTTINNTTNNTTNNPVVDGRIISRTLSGLNLNVSADTAITGLPVKWRLLRCYAHGVSTSLGLSLASLGCFTASSGGGSNCITSLLTGLTTALQIADQTVSNTVRTVTTCYIRPVITHGSAATCNVTLQFEDLT